MNLINRKQIVIMSCIRIKTVLCYSQVLYVYIFKPYYAFAPAPIMLTLCSNFTFNK